MAERDLDRQIIYYGETVPAFRAPVAPRNFQAKRSGIAMLTSRT